MSDPSRQDRGSRRGMELGGGGLSGVYGDPVKAPGAHGAGAQIAPEVPGSHWWRKPVYRTPQWWRQRGWPIPSRSGVVVTTIISIAVVLLAIMQAKRSYNEVRMQALIALIERCADDPENTDCTKRTESTVVYAMRGIIIPPKRDSGRSVPSNEQDDGIENFDTSQGE